MTLGFRLSVLCLTQFGDFLGIYIICFGKSVSGGPELHVGIHVGIDVEELIFPNTVRYAGNQQV